MIRFQIVIFCCLYTTVSSVLDSRLKHFETLNHDSLRHHITKRDIYSQFPNERKVDYDALGRHFRLVLQRSSSLLSADFRVVAIKGDEETVVDVKPSMYHGYLEDEPDTSSITAYWEDDQTLSASIKTKSDVYIVEPSWRHLPNATNVTMITYKASDVDMERDFGKNFCGYIRVNASEDEEGDEESEVYDDEEITGQSDSRVKRQAGSCVKDDKTTCSLLLVADYRFYQSMSLQSLSKTTGYMISQIDRIDTIYRSQDFGNCGSNLGFEIREIRIHETPTPASEKTLHYNMQKTDWDTTQLLEVFSTEPRFEHFCLAHLFTHTAFDNGVLGLAYIGSPRSYSVGGICSPSYTKAGTKMFLNTGWSSSLNRYNRKLLTQEAMLVTAHEFGHNWGSEHDPDTTECSPPASIGGKYIMFTYSVSGIDSNNKIFSPCSKRSIGAVLRVKADVCFSKKAGGFCGNSHVEEGEECDEGPQGSSPGKRCCTDKCKFSPGSICSDVNQECCEKCVFSPPTKICYSQQDALCEGEAKCSGKSADCPSAPPKPDGSECLERGHCRNKECMSFCEYNGKISCICDKVETSCKWCCKDNATSECNPYTAGNTTVSSFDLPNGMPCIQGFCDKGTCEKQVHDMVQRLWDIIENITVDKLVKFMRANIVGTVIILSLVIWIPGSCIVAYIDRKRAREEKDEVDWLTNKDSLVYNKDSVKIINPDGRRTTRS